MHEIRKLLRVRNLEDYYGYEYIYNIIIICFLVFLGMGDLQLRISSHLFSLFWISINTFQIFTFFKRKKCEFILSISSKKEKSKFLMFFWGSILENMIFLIFMVCYIAIFFQANIINTLFIAVVHFVFAISLGIFSAYLRNWICGLLVIVFYYLGGFYIASSWTWDEFFRYSSVTLQLYNVNKIHTINIISLIIFTIVLLLTSKYLSKVYEKNRILKITGIIGACLISLTLIIACELIINNKIANSSFTIIEKNHHTVKYKGVDKESADVLSNIVIYLENECVKIGIKNMRIKEIQINRYNVSILNMLYHTRSIPVTVENGIFYVNVFSNAMLNIKEPEMVRSFVDRSYDQMINSVENIDNKYVYQIVEGCREQICRNLFYNNKNIPSADLVKESNERIAERNKTPVTQSNFLKKIVNIVFESYQEDISGLYSKVQSELPESNEEFGELLKINYPKIFEDDEIQKIMNLVIGGK